jgi:hypothetical protein
MFDGYFYIQLTSGTKILFDPGIFTYADSAGGRHLRFAEIPLSAADDSKDQSRKQRS